MTSDVSNAPTNVTPPAQPSVGPALDSINRDFHAAYAGQRAVAEQDHAVFVILSDELVVLHRAQRRAFPIAPPSFHAIKSIAHAPIAAFALLLRASDDRDSKLRALRGRLIEARAELHQPELADARSDLELVIATTVALLDSVLDGSASENADAIFAHRIGQVLLRLTSAATALQLRRLHEQTEHAFDTLAPEEHAFVHVVVAGAHQARARSLAMQYFQMRFNESPGAEWRVTYAEAASSERAALELVGTQRLDRRIAHAFFGDARRLQRDILGDSAAQLLKEWKAPR